MIGKTPIHLLRVGVIGGGPAGALCARVLSKRVGSVTVFDKGRSPGGRLSTRRSGTTQFDHGAQYLTARDPSMEELVRQWTRAGVIAPWEGLEVDLRASDQAPREPSDVRHVGVPGMDALVRDLLQGLDIRLDERVTGMSRQGDQIEVSLSSSAAERLDVVVVAVPGPQATPLLGYWPRLQEPVAKVRYHPCWATMVELAQAVDVPWTAARTGDPRVGWIARDHTKPGRPAAESWVLHATPDWTREHLEDAREEVGQTMLAAARELIGISAPATMIQSHRWLYALVDQPIGEDCLFEDGVGLCGDALRGSRIESALFTGLALAKRILAA
jgi:renalase